MKYCKVFLTLLAAVLFPCLASAQNPEMTEVIPRMPVVYTEVLNELSLSSVAPDTVPVYNLFYGESSIKEITDNYLLIQVTDVSTIEIKRLKDNKGNPMYVGVYTIYGPAPDSEVRFFNADMKELPTKKFIKLPTTKDYFSIPKGSVTKKKELEEMLPFTTAKAELSPDNDSITFSMDPQDYMDRDDYNIMKLFLQPITYRWVNGKYQLKDKR